MQCQYIACTNIGVHSCSQCGKLVCGKHAHISSGHTVSVKCESCWQIEQQAKEKQYEADKKSQKGGCLTAVLGIVSFIISLVFMANEGSMGVYDWRIWVFLITGIILFFIG